MLVVLTNVLAEWGILHLVNKQIEIEKQSSVT